MPYDLVIAYRIYPRISKVPPAYPHDKFKLSKLCLESLATALVGLKVKMYVLLDGCPAEYAQLFRTTCPAIDLELLELPTIGNKQTFKKQIEILSEQNDAEVVYFAEDDYFYIKPLKNMVDFVRRGKANFVTPYEHPVCYTTKHVIDNHLSLFEGQRYATVQHACLTFMTSKKTLLANQKFLRIFSDWFGSDFVVWGCITLGSRFFLYLRLLVHPRNYTLESLKVYGSMWYFAWYRFIINRKFKLYMPINTFATHMEQNFLSPGVDWSTVFNNKQ